MYIPTDKRGKQMYQVDFKKVVYKTTKRGVNATCDILKDGNQVCQLIDQAESIVATVTFYDQAEYPTFLAAAKEFNSTNKHLIIKDLPHNEEFIVGEYARSILADAEGKFIAAGGTVEVASVETRVAKQPVLDTGEPSVNKAAMARAIFKEVFAMSPVPARKDIIDRVIRETGLTPAGAATYLQKYKTDNGLVQKRS